MSEQSPRDALESAIGMIDTYDVVEGDVVPQCELWDVVNAAREVLAAQPSEPALVVTDEAVAAAARVFFGGAYGAVGDEGNKVLHDAARDALGAALPHLAPQLVVDREAVLSILARFGVGEGPDASSTSTAAYRGHLADAVMERARPMPTREEIAQAYFSHATKGDLVPRSWEKSPEWAKRKSYEMADFILALLTGSAK
jgi:hypothetical protein